MGSEVEPLGFILKDLLVFPRFVKLLLCTIGRVSPKANMTEGVLCMQQGHPQHMPPVLFQDEMLFCDSCDRGFHMECCDPPLSRMPKGKVFTLASGFPSLLSIQSLFFIEGLLGLSLSTARQQWLIRSFACISNYSSIPREIWYLWITVHALQLGL